MTDLALTFRQGDAVDLSVNVDGGLHGTFDATLSTSLSEAPTSGQVTFIESPTNIGKAQLTVDAGYTVGSGLQLRVFVSTSPITSPASVMPGDGVNIVTPGVAWESTSTFSGGTTVYGYLYLVRDSDEALIDTLDLGNFQVAEPAGSTEITQTQPYVFSERPLCDGEYRWFWRHRGSGATNSKYSHPDGIASVVRTSYSNDVAKTDDWEKVSEGDVLYVIDTVTTNSPSSIEETFQSSVVVVQPVPVCPAFDAADVLLEDSPSLDGNELKLTINSWPDTGEIPDEELPNQEIEDPRTISHVEYSTDSTDGTDGTWKRADGYANLGARPIIVPAGHTGKVWLRAVNRLNSKGTAYDYPSPPTPTTGTPTVTVSCTRGATKPGPAPFIFTVEAWGFSVEEPKKDLRYTFSYPAETRTAGRKAALISGEDYAAYSSTDDSETFGAIGGCVVDSELIDFAGGASVTRTVTCTVGRHTDVDDTNDVSDDITVTILNPDQHWSGTDTICVGDGNDWSGAPSGATQVTSRAALLSAVSGKTNVRILFQRGVDHGETHGNDEISPPGDISIGAFGTGDPPIVRRGFQFNNGCPGSKYIWGIDWIGPYDPEDPYSLVDKPENALTFKGGHDSDSIQMLWDNKFHGWNKAALYAHHTLGQLSAGNDISKWLDYGEQQGDSGQMVMMFDVVRQPAGTIIAKPGPDGSKKWSTQKTSWHGPYRFSRADDYIAIICCILGPNGNHASSPGMQPPARALRGDDRGRHIVLSGTIGDGGFMEIGAGEAYDPHGANDIVIDNCLFHGLTHGGAVYGVKTCGQVFRNCIFIEPNTPRWTGSGPAGSSGAMIQHEIAEVWFSDMQLTSKIISSTFYDAKNTTNRTLSGTAQPYVPTKSSPKDSFVAMPNFEMIDCAHVSPDAPSAEGGVTLDTGMDFASVTYSSIFEGWYLAPPMTSSSDVPTVTFYPQYAAPTVGLPRSQVGASVYQDASSDLVRTDFLGNTRGANPSRGALEPS